MRDIRAIATVVDGVRYRSQTEARWAVFLNALGITFEYEAQRLELSDGTTYLPDFWIPDLKAYFEVKGRSDAIVTEEAAKARRLAADREGLRVWLAIGPPDCRTANILPLDQWDHEEPIETILETPENRYRFLADQRDDGVFWLQADFVEGGFKMSYLVGGPGRVTEHDRLPIESPTLTAAFKKAADARW